MSAVKSIALYTFLLFITVTGHCQTGPFSPAVGQEGSTAIHKDSSIIQLWATEVIVNRGPMDINIPELGMADYGVIEDVLGYANNSVLSLGDGGEVTYYLSQAIANGDGYDFVIFENAFDDYYLELGFVEVSSDDINYYRFPSISLTQDSIQTDGFGLTDPTNIHNLAGKYRLDYGTPFNLDDLEGIPGLNTSNITSVKVIDVIGNITAPNISIDSQGNVINDPYPTPFASSGFDLDALGLINIASGISDLVIETVFTYPNPVENICYIRLTGGESMIEIIDISGKNHFNQSLPQGTQEIDTSNLPSGIYVVIATARNGQKSITKIVKADKL